MWTAVDVHDPTILWIVYEFCARLHNMMNRVFWDDVWQARLTSGASVILGIRFNDN